MTTCGSVVMVDFNAAMALAPSIFSPDFRAWLLANEHIARAFVDQADVIRTHGRDHYSARTILHWLRHHTAMSEGPDGTLFKINNNVSASLARLYMLARPEATGFFKIRERRHG